MIETLIFIIITSAFCMGLHMATDEGFILNFVAKYFERQFNKGNSFIFYLSKPLITCPPCMASLWSCVLFYLFHHCMPVDLLVIIPAVSFLNSIFTKYFYS